jgi:hypothetical protein
MPTKPPTLKIRSWREPPPYGLVLTLAHLLVILSVIIVICVLSADKTLTTTAAGLLGSIVGISGTSAFHNGSAVHHITPQVVKETGDPDLSDE